MSDQMEWTRTWPKEPGIYWFYGRPYRSSPEETFLVRVYLTANKMCAYVCEGHFLFEGEASNGLWMPAVLPKPENDSK